MRKLFRVPPGISLALLITVSYVTGVRAQVALPASTTAAVVYHCPEPYLKIGNNPPVALSWQNGRAFKNGIVCTYTLFGDATIKRSGERACPETVFTDVVGPNGASTDSSRGCQNHGSWCHGPALPYKGLHLRDSSHGVCSYGGGSVDLSTMIPQGTCFSGTGEGTGGGFSPSGAFLCF